MKPTRSTPENLNAALEQWQASGLALDAYLARHPEAAPLAMLLRAAERAGRAGGPMLTLGATAQAAGEQRLRAGFRMRRSAQQPAGRRWALALATLLLVLGTAAGTASAAGAALPGEILYPVKRLVESGRMALTAPSERPRLQVELARTRLAEQQALQARDELSEAAIDETRSAIHLAAESLAEAPATDRDALLAALLGVLDGEQASLEDAAREGRQGTALAAQQALQGSRADRDTVLAHSPPTPEGPPAALPGSPMPSRTRPAHTPTPAQPTREAPALESPPPGQGNPPPGQGNPPPGQGNPPPGQGNTPPGQGNTPPGQGNPPPGQGNPPPGQGNTPPGQGNTPPGQGNTPPGQGNPPPGQGNTPPGQGNTPPGQEQGGGQGAEQGQGSGQGQGGGGQGQGSGQGQGGGQGRQNGGGN